MDSYYVDNPLNREDIDTQVDNSSMSLRHVGNPQDKVGSGTHVDIMEYLGMDMDMDMWREQKEELVCFYQLCLCFVQFVHMIPDCLGSELLVHSFF